MKKLKQHHHFIISTKKVEAENSKVYPLTVNRTINESELSEEEKEECRQQLRNCLKTNRKFIKDLREAKKPMVIHEKLMADKWRLHAMSMDKIRRYAKGDVPTIEEEIEDTEETGQESIEETSE
jgi:signal transduction histidine kinase